MLKKGNLSFRNRSNVIRSKACKFYYIRDDKALLKFESGKILFRKVHFFFKKNKFEDPPTIFGNGTKSSKDKVNSHVKKSYEYLIKNNLYFGCDVTFDSNFISDIKEPDSLTFTYMHSVKANGVPIHLIARKYTLKNDAVTPGNR